MTRKKQKDEEVRHTRNFFETLFKSGDSGIDVESLDPPNPDVCVQGAQLAQIAGPGAAVFIELREYHVTDRILNASRVEVEQRWQNELLPKIDALRRGKPSLMNVAASLKFKNLRHPPRRNHQAISEDLVLAIESAVPLIPSQESVQVGFHTREDIAKLPFIRGWTFLISEDFSVAAEHLDTVRLEFNRYEKWPLWSCPFLMFAWNTPSGEAFAEILEEKRRKARAYNIAAKPLWLLIVADLQNDLQSHVFPRDDENLRFVRELISGTGFDFAAGPFEQVWLFSDFAQRSLRLYPIDNHSARELA